MIAGAHWQAGVVMIIARLSESESIHYGDSDSARDVTVASNAICRDRVTGTVSGHESSSGPRPVPQGPGSSRGCTPGLSRVSGACR